MPARIAAPAAAQPHSRNEYRDTDRGQYGSGERDAETVQEAAEEDLLAAETPITARLQAELNRLPLQ
jgi:hypothetical protein